MKDPIISIRLDTAGLEEEREEPEREVHIDGNTSKKMKECQQELQNRLAAIEALRELVLEQRRVIQSLQSNRQGIETVPQDTSNIESREVKDETRQPPCSRPSPLNTSNESEQYGSTDDSDFIRQSMAYGQPIVRADGEDVMSALTEEGSETVWSSVLTSLDDDDIRDVIESIREQACQLNTAIALEKLEETKHDLHLATKELRHRSSEVGELKSQIKSIESRFATLELERDLHQADAIRARADLKQCLQHMARLKTESIIALTFDEDEGSSEKSRSDAHDPDEETTVLDDSVAPVTPIKPRQCFPQIENQSKVVWRTLDKEEAGSDTNHGTPRTHLSDSTSRSPLFPDSHSTSSAITDVVPKRRCSDARNLALCFWTQRSRESRHKGPKFELMDDSPFSPGREPVVRKRFSKKGKKSTKDKKLSDQQRDEAITREKSVRLNHLLTKTSREVDQLRSHLGSVTRSYNETLASLQLHGSSHKFSGLDTETAMIQELSKLEAERRETSAKLSEKSALIGHLQKELATMLSDLRSGSSDIPLQEKIDS